MPKKALYCKWMSWGTAPRPVADTLVILPLQTMVP